MSDQFIGRGGVDAATRVGSTSPFQGINLGTLGNVTIGPNGIPSVAGDPNINAAQNQLLGISSDAGRAAQGLISPTGAFAGQALQAGSGLLADAAGFDPLSTAEARFSRLQSVLGPERGRQRDTLDSRLLAQGRLDGTAGNILGGQLEQGFAEADANLFDRLFLESEQAQTNARNQALALGQGGAQIGGGLFAELGAGASQAQGLDQGLLQSLGAGQSIGQAFINRDIAGSNAINSFNTGGRSGNNGVGGAIGTVLGGAVGGYFGGPAGVAAGAKAGGAAGNLFT